LDILIEASEKIVEIHPEIRFKFIISPQLRKVYTRVLREINSSKLSKCSLVFSQLPYSSLIDELLTSNCVIIPSLCEGFGFTAAEASAMKIPIISSGMGSLPEVVSGRVITMKEYNAQGLLMAMESAIANELEEVAKKRFSIDDFVKNHNLLYQHVTEGTF
jgi:glycosyltransferase involved in cell wall biosynthesis